MWKWLEQYFTFSKGEKAGILTLVILSIALLILPKVYFFFSPVKQNINSPYDKEVEAFEKEYQAKKQLAAGSVADQDQSETFNPYANVKLSSHFKTKKQKETEYFDFDPNKIGVAEWVRLGFSNKQAESIEKAKAKGWKFCKPEDLKKIYVVGEENYKRLARYIKIEQDVTAPKKQYATVLYHESRNDKVVLDINTADSASFEGLKGLGPSLASRIIKYRTRLGGFVSPEQIKEVWGLPDSTYQSLKDRFVVRESSVAKINLNSADFETLGKHPYINYAYAKVIKAYRDQHGNFKKTEDLKKIPIMNDSIFSKIEPYIRID
jgi:competence protein ComEA